MAKKNDLVYDPFMGYGTTASVCIENKRNYLGSEIIEEYYNASINILNNHEHRRFVK